MRTHLLATILGTTLVVATAAWPSHAQNQNDINKSVQAIAAELQKGNNAKAKELAAAEAKNQDISDVMRVFRPKKKGGLGAEDGFIVAAVGEIASANPPIKNKAGWIGNAKNLRNFGLALANANAAQKPNARANVEKVCNACHGAFKN